MHDTLNSSYIPPISKNGVGKPINKNRASRDLICDNFGVSSFQLKSIHIAKFSIVASLLRVSYHFFVEMC
jgi:hypothetical protein